MKGVETVFTRLLEMVAERRRVKQMMRGVPIRKVHRADYYNPTVMRHLPGRRWAA